MMPEHTFTRIGIDPAANGFILTGWSWESSEQLVAKTWDEVLALLRTIELRQGPRPPRVDEVTRDPAMYGRPA